MIRKENRLQLELTYTLPPQKCDANRFLLYLPLRRSNNSSCAGISQKCELTRLGALEPEGILDTPKEIMKAFNQEENTGAWLERVLWVPGTHEILRSSR